MRQDGKPELEVEDLMAQHHPEKRVDVLFPAPVAYLVRGMYGTRLPGLATVVGRRQTLRYMVRL